MAKHFELTDETKVVDGITVHRIRATKDNPFFNIKKGMRGGYVQHINNLAGDAWIGGDAVVMQDARAIDRARIGGKATLSGKALAADNVYIGGRATLSDNSMVFGFANITGEATLTDSCQIGADTVIAGNARIGGSVKIYLLGSTPIAGYAHITHQSHILTIGAVDGYDQDLVMVRQRLNLPPRVTVGYWTGDLDGFVPEMRRRRDIALDAPRPGATTGKGAASKKFWADLDPQWAAIKTLCDLRVASW